MSRVKPYRATPRRRAAPERDATWWAWATARLTTRSGWRCEKCGHPLREPIERHHRLPRREGGDRLANLLLLHRECHRYITEHPTEAYANGWMVHAETDPANVPVRIDGILWTLDDKGEKHPLP